MFFRVYPIRTSSVQTKSVRLKSFLYSEQAQYNMSKISNEQMQRLLYLRVQMLATSGLAPLIKTQLVNWQT